MNLQHCLINLSKLQGSELDSGYSLLGIKSLFNNKDMILNLPFTRSQFIQELPERQVFQVISQNSHYV